MPASGGPSECGVWLWVAIFVQWKVARARGIGSGFKWKSLVHTGRVRIVFKSFRLQSEIAATVSIRLKDVSRRWARRCSASWHARQGRHDAEVGAVEEAPERAPTVRGRVGRVLREVRSSLLSLPEGVGRGAADGRGCSARACDRSEDGVQ